MAISHHKTMSATCPVCATDITGTVWYILDAHEHPAEMEALRAGTLNTLICPACGWHERVNSPLLLHDGAARRVMFAPSPSATEPLLREQAYELHTLLIDRIPPERRQHYLTDVHIAQDISGIAHLLNKFEQRSRRIPAHDSPRHAPSPAPGPTPLHDQHETMIAALHELMHMNHAEEIAPVLARHPILRHPDTDRTIGELIEHAFAHREHDTVRALQDIRHLLQSNRSLPALISSYMSDMVHTPESERLHEHSPVDHVSPDMSPDILVYALMHANTSDDLQQLLGQYPLLLSPAIDDHITQMTNDLLLDGNETLALLLEDRRARLWDLFDSSG